MADKTRRQILLGMAAAAFLPPLHIQAQNKKPVKNTAVKDSSDKLKESLMNVLGDMPARPKANLKILESVKINGGVRHKIEYLPEPAGGIFNTPPDFIRAYLFVPEHKTGAKLPAIVAIHQDGPQSHIGKSEPAGLAGDKNQFYGLELFERGYVVICPDRFEHAERRRVMPNDVTSIDVDRDDRLVNHWAGQLLLSGRTSFGKEVYDLMVTADVLESLEYVNKNRIGAIGHSAGGNILVYFMFADSRIKTGVSSCGLFSLLNFFNEHAPKRRMSAFALPGLAKVGDSADYLSLIAPRPLMLTRGLWEWGKDGEGEQWSKNHVEETRKMENQARKRYLQLKAPENLKVDYFEEAGGNHDFPPGIRQKAYQWIDINLNVRSMESY